MYGTTQHPTLLHTAKYNTFTIAFSVLHSRLILHRYVFINSLQNFMPMDRSFNTSQN